MSEHGKTVEIYKKELSGLAPEFKKALPPHISPERFVRVCLTALSNKPELFSVPVRSFCNAAMACANDGLIPDGNEAVIMLFKSRKPDTPPSASYMPMLAGMVKTAYQSGEIKEIVVEVVRENDAFRNVKGDEAHIEHEVESWDEEDRGDMVGAYAIAHLMNGGAIRRTLSRKKILKIKSKSLMRNPDKGPWGEFQEEMWCKAVFKTLHKWLPKSRDGRMDAVMKSDNQYYDLDDAIEGEAVEVETPPAIEDQTETEDETPPAAPEEAEVATEDKAQPPEAPVDDGPPDIPSGMDDMPPGPDDIPPGPDDAPAAPETAPEPPADIDPELLADHNIDKLMDSFFSSIKKAKTVAQVDKIINQFKPVFKKNKRLTPPDMEDIDNAIIARKKELEK